MKRRLFIILLGGVLALLGTGLGRSSALAQDESEVDTISVSESDYYRIENIPIPERVKLEVSGMTTLPGGRLGVATRRGEVWLIENVVADGEGPPRYKRFARGLHHPTGLAYTDGVFYSSTMGELTRMIDRDGDERADVYEAVTTWPMSGNHHAFSYGPEVLPDGRLWVTLNLDSPGYGMDRYSSVVKWRGWSAIVTPEGDFQPIATGMKAPAGFGRNMEGDMFYAENDGKWIGSGWITHVEEGDFLGHPAGLRWKDFPKSPVETDWTHEDIPDSDNPMFEVAEKMPAFKLPTVWFPTGPMGSATLDILPDSTGGAFGPFEGQLFVGDQGHNKLMRVFLEKVNGGYQGAVFNFRDGFSSGLLRQVWAPDGSMILGSTTRGWPNPGLQYDLQRLVWTGKTPLEIKAVRAQPDGFELEFTRPVAKEPLTDPANYSCTNFTYKYHSGYGSPIIRQEDCPIRGLKVSEGGKTVRLAVENMRRYYVHGLTLEGLYTPSGVPLLHNTTYYTLNNIPEGETLSDEQLILAGEPAQPAPEKAVPEESEPTEQEAGATSGAVPDQPKYQTEMPESWTEGPDNTITIETDPGLTYDISSFSVPAGGRIKLVFRNTDDLLHNVVFTMPGTMKEVAMAAMDMGLGAQSKAYVPESDNVIFHTSLLQPGETESIFFTAPTQPDKYPYVCTFPGHWRTMNGIMRVVK